MRLIKRNLIISIINDLIVDYPTPINISYFWGFGSPAGLCLDFICLVMHYFWFRSVFLFPWVYSIGKLGILGFWIMILFLIILTIGFIYEWRWAINYLWLGKKENE